MHAMATTLGVKKFLGPDCRERDLVYGLILSRVLRPTSTLSTLDWWNDTTLGTDLGITQASTDEVYAAVDWLGQRELTMVGDRGMITNARIKELRDRGGMDWVTALRAPAISALASDDGPLQMSLFDTQNFAEVTHPDYPGERLIRCRNPALAESRAHKREELLAATDTELATITTRVRNGKLRGADAIGVTVGKIVNEHKMAKHFTLAITDNTFDYHRDQQRIDAEAALDGIHVIRTSLDTESLDTPSVITAYKNLAYVERDFRIIKADDLDLRPLFRYLSERVRSHVFLCMLAAYITWHLRETLAPLTYTDQHIPHRTDPVPPAQRSPSAKTKDATKKTPDGLPARSFRDLLEHLSHLNRETINFTSQRIEKITNPTPTQRRVFELIGAPIPLTLTTT